MKRFKTIFILLILAANLLVAQDEYDYLNDESFTFPQEDEQHEGTWLQWPHHHQYGLEYSTSLDPTWVAMAKALAPHEKVHIIAYDGAEQARIIMLLESTEVNLDSVDFTIAKTDDVWIRDSGPIYVRDSNDSLVILDFGFNGWGKKKDPNTRDTIAYQQCDSIPIKIGKLQNRRVINLNKVLINEGGSIDTDGAGTLMACKSSILNPNRNPKLPIQLLEFLFEKHFGVTNFIWLKGEAGFDITDQHIDGFARFRDSTHMLTMKKYNLEEFGVSEDDIKKLYHSRNKHGQGYTFIFLPLTKRNVRTSYGRNLSFKGSYLNYYVANKVVLVPNYHDKHDNFANKIIQSMYPNRKVIGIDVRDLYSYGGMVHCVTQQQPKE